MDKGEDNSSYDGSMESQRELELDYERDVEEYMSQKGVMQKFAYYRNYPFRKIARHPILLKSLIYGIIFLAYNAYFIGVLYRYIKNGLEWEWCDKFGFLIILTAITYAGLIYYHIIKRFFGPFLERCLVNPFSRLVEYLFSNDWICGLGYLVVVLAVAIFLVIDAWEEPERLISAGGIVIIVLFGFLCSAHPGHVRWRHVGRNIFNCLADKVTIFLDFTDEGSSFVFGYLVTGMPLLDDPLVIDTVFMFKTLSVIYFFSFCVSMLFYLGALQFVVLKLGWLLSVTIGTTAAESLNAAANIFLGQTEAPLLIRPFLPIMTKSEIHAVMAGGFATIAGTVLAAYISFGIDAAQLISASVMAAPAALAFSKLFYPETEESKTTIADVKLPRGEEANILDAAAQGASNAIMLVLNIAASLIAFLAFVAFLNAIISWLGEMTGLEQEITFEYLLGYVFVPVAFIMGVPWADCEQVGRLIGLKTIINEFKAFQELGILVDAGAISPRAAAIATFALCGFANPGSIGIQLGGLGSMAPDRKKDLAQIVFRAFVSGCFTSFLNACVAGSLISTA
eukprot:snap_masked-scaffold624_size122968-processed-gene-0.7 protein:Tk09513 transcript:snap_masked-scaffold624_size122968-processed-gene-0.7-mRNA-1 annotation:"hypothetical protein DAPPUDRAFT_306527"